MTVEQSPGPEPEFDPQKRSDEIAEHGHELAGSQPISSPTAPPEAPTGETGSDDTATDDGDTGDTGDGAPPLV